MGINAATTALWLDRVDDAEKLAEQVRAADDDLQDRLRAAGYGERPLDYWDQVTLAQAELLRGQLDRAGQLYREAFGQSQREPGRIAVTKGQARRILERLGLAHRAAEILGSP